MQTIADLLTAHLVDLARSGFTWDRSNACYRDALGHKIQESRIRRISQAWVAMVEERIQDITQRFIDGKITLDDWHKRMAQELLDAAIIQALLGRGGLEQFTSSNLELETAELSAFDYAQFTNRAHEQFGWLKRFAQQIKDGIETAGNIMRRALGYAKGTELYYHDAKTYAKADAGYTEEMRVLGIAEHCQDCPPLSGYWAPIGSLPQIGATQCGKNCKCQKVFRKVVMDKDGNVSYVEA